MLGEGGEYHNFICVECWDVLTDGRTSLQHLTIREKMARDELADLIFVSNRRPEQVCVCEAAMAREEDCGEHRKI
jgi:hypothetical protein